MIPVTRNITVFAIKGKIVRRHAMTISADRLPNAGYVEDLLFILFGNLDRVVFFQGTRKIGHYNFGVSANV